MILSIIIPVYNTEKYLKRCLDSVLSQYYKDIEIILVDDGSTDQSGFICDEYAARDKRICVIHKENGGAGSARKCGLANATGEYITCIDADDWIEEDAYSDLMNVVNKCHPDLVACSFVKEFDGFQVIRNDYPEEGLYSKSEFYDVMRTAINEMPFFCQIVNGSLCCKLFRREYFEKYQNAVPSEIVLSEDLAVVLPMLFDIESVYICKKPYYHYCQNKESSCWKWRSGEYERLQTLVKYLRNYYELYDDVVYRRLILHTIYFAMMDLLYDVPATYFEKGIPFLRDICKDNRVVIYGKGVYATNLIEVLKKYQLCNVVCNVDSADADILFSMGEDEYDYVLIAILDCLITEKVMDYLKYNDIDENKVLMIDKSDLSLDNLPEELWCR